MSTQTYIEKNLVVLFITVPDWTQCSVNAHTHTVAYSLESYSIEYIQHGHRKNRSQNNHTEGKQTG